MTDKPDIQDSQLLTLKIISLALLGGSTMFLGVIGLLASMRGEAEPSSEADASLLLMLTGMAVGMSVITNILGPFLQKASMKTNLAQGPNSSEFMKFQTGLLVRLAMAEGPALFGLVALLMGVLGGNIPPFLWLSLIPYGLQVVVTVMTFPSRRAIEEAFSTGPKYRK